MSTTIAVTCVCSAHYRAPAKLAGRRLKCRKCSQPIRVPEADDDLIPLEIVEDEAPVISQPVVAFAPAPAEPTPAVGTGGMRQLTAFWADCVRSLMFIIEPGAIPVFLVAAALAAIQPLLNFAGPFGFIGRLIVLGWLFSYLFSVVVEAASGETRLPEFEMLEHPIDSIVVPSFKFMAVWVICLAPMIVYTLFIDVDWTTPFSDIGLLITLALGAAAWPMTCLVLALGGVECFARPDLLLGTIARTLVPYGATCLMTGAVFAGSVAVQFGVVVAGSGKSLLLILCLIEVVQIYALIVVMRFTGFYYHHFKDRFAWGWG